MSGYVDRLVGRTLGLVPTLQPRRRSRFEPAATDGARVVELLSERDAPAGSGEPDGQPGDGGGVDRAAGPRPATARSPASTGRNAEGEAPGGLSALSVTAAGPPAAAVGPSVAAVGPSVAGAAPARGDRPTVPGSDGAVPTSGVAGGIVPTAGPHAVAGLPVAPQPLPGSAADGSPAATPTSPVSSRLGGEVSVAVERRTVNPHPGAGVPVGTDGFGTTAGDPVRAPVHRRPGNRPAGDVAAAGPAAGNHETEVPRTPVHAPVATGPLAEMVPADAAAASGPAAPDGGSETAAAGVWAAEKPPARLVPTAPAETARQATIGLPPLPEGASAPGRADPSAGGGLLGPGAPSVGNGRHVSPIRPVPVATVPVPVPAAIGPRNTDAHGTGDGLTEPRPPTVTVTIGRIEVHTPPAPPPVAPEPGPGPLSLEAYLDRRNSGSR